MATWEKGMNTGNGQDRMPNRFSDGLDAFIRTIGHVIMWTNFVLIFVIILQVILRYGFGRGLVVLEELQWQSLFSSRIPRNMSRWNRSNRHHPIDRQHRL